MPEPRWTVANDGRLTISKDDHWQHSFGAKQLGYMPDDWYDALVAAVRDAEVLRQARELAKRIRAEDYDESDPGHRDGRWLVGALLDLLGSVPGTGTPSAEDRDPCPICDMYGHPAAWHGDAPAPGPRKDTDARWTIDEHDERIIDPGQERCPECGGYGLRGCGAAWHDDKPDTHCSPACQCRDEMRHGRDELRALVEQTRRERGPTLEQQAVIDAAVAWAETWATGAVGNEERQALFVAVARLWNADHPGAVPGAEEDQ